MFAGCSHASTRLMSLMAALFRSTNAKVISVFLTWKGFAVVSNTGNQTTYTLIIFVIRSTSEAGIH